MNQILSYTIPITTPVLFLVFNRLDTTQQVFQSIREAKPPKLYIASDGPRTDKEDEAEKVREVRDYIVSNIDWSCEVKTLFRDENLGCRKAVSSAIDWFFENEETGIILEDDCLPCQGFFWFCENLLKKYENDTRIMCISGNNIFQDSFNFKSSYSFSEIPLIWGWASWRRAWKMNNEAFNSFKEIYAMGIPLVANHKANKMWWKKIGKTIKNEIDTWDYLWTFANLVNNGLTIIPYKNLVKNIGLGHISSTHTNKVIKNFIVETHELSFPLSHPPVIKANFNFDSMLYKNLFNVIPLWKKIIRKIRGEI